MNKTALSIAAAFTIGVSATLGIAACNVPTTPPAPTPVVTPVAPTTQAGKSYTLPACPNANENQPTDCYWLSPDPKLDSFVILDHQLFLNGVQEDPNYAQDTAGE